MSDNAKVPSLRASDPPMASPPPGPFDQRALCTTRAKAKDVYLHSCLINADRIPDLIKGMCRAHATCYSREVSRKEYKVRDRAGGSALHSSNRTGQLQSSTAIDSQEYAEVTTYQCAYGPNDGNKKCMGLMRMGSRHPDSGRSIKQGCASRFTVRILSADRSIARVDFSEAPHSGKEVTMVDGAQRHPDCPWVSAETKQKIVEMYQLIPGTSAKSILDAVKKEIRRRAGLESAKNVDANLLRLQYPDMARDWELKRKDIM